MPDDQSSIPTKPIPLPPEPPPTDSIAAAMFGVPRSASGGGWQPPSPEELQRDFPLYEIRGILGRGGMGAVYKGWQKSLDRFVAIKVLPPGLDDGISGFTERFKREAKAMAQLKHPGIVPVFDAGTTASGLLYFIMECIEGTDVQCLVSAQGRLPEEQALAITTHVLDALAYAHGHGVIHRDIKPSNIMLDAEGNVKVADFGLAKSTAPETTLLTGSDVTMGTPEFMAPEAMLGAANVDHRADLYAVGVMLYQMLTGKIPRGRFVPPSRAVPGLDKRLDSIVDKALQPDREARYSSALELRTAIAPILTRAVSKRGATAAGAASSRKKALAIGIAAVVASLGIVAWIAFGKDEPQVQDPGGAAKAEQSSLAFQRENAADGLKPSTPLPATGSASPSPRVSPSPQFPPGKWVKVFTNAEDISEVQRKQGFDWRDGWIDGGSSTGSPLMVISGTRGRNQGIRLRGKVVAGVELPFVQLVIRRTSSGPEIPKSYRLGVNGESRTIQAIYHEEGGGKGTAPAKQRLGSIELETPPKPGVQFDMELIAIGDKLYGKFNGRPLPAITDARLTEGMMGVHTPHRVRDIEVINLDGLSEAEALKAVGIGE